MENVGYAALQVIPTFKGLEGNLERGTSPILSRSGVKGGAVFGDSAGRSMSSRFVSHAKSAAVLATGVLTGVTALGIKIGRDSIDEAREAQRVGAITTRVIKSTGQAANVTARQVGKLSTAISNRVGIDDEAIQSGANLLLTFKNIQNQTGKGNKIFDEATKITTDMAVAMAGGNGGTVDLKSSSILVGKALNDPVKGLTALTRVGVSFTDQQTKQIKSLVEQGKTMQAQKIILGELQSEFGGTAAAQATMGDKVRVAWGNIEESIGTTLLPLIDDLERAFLKKGVPALEDFSNWFAHDGKKGIHNFIEDARPLANSILPAAKNGLKDIAGFLSDAAPKAKAVIDAFNNLPDWAQKAVVLGGAGALISKKSGLLSFGSKALTGGSGSPGGGLLGLFTKAKPLPVLVVNEGFGPGVGGGLPGGGKAGKDLTKFEKFQKGLPLWSAQGILVGGIAFEGAQGVNRGVRNIVKAQSSGFSTGSVGGDGPRTSKTHPFFTEKGVTYFDPNTGKTFIGGGPNDPYMKRLKATSNATDSLKQHVEQASAAIDLASRRGSQNFAGLTGRIDTTSDRTDILDRKLRGLPKSLRTELSLDDREARRRLAAFRAEAQKSLSLEIAGPHMGRPGDLSSLDGIRRR